MPNPKVGTVTMDVATAVKNAKAGQVQYRTDKGGIIHATIGRASFPVEKLEENLKALIDALNKGQARFLQGPVPAQGRRVQHHGPRRARGPGHPGRLRHSQQKELWAVASPSGVGPRIVKDRRCRREVLFPVA